MRRYQTKAVGGRIIKPASHDLVDHVRFALHSARNGTRCWIKSRDPDDELSRFYSAEFRQQQGTVAITCYEWHIQINPRHPSSPAWLTELTAIVDNLTQGAPTT